MQIEKGIPVHSNPSMTYPFVKMEVGDSFVVPAKNANTARTAAARFRRNNPTWRFVTRVIGDDLRVWRTQ